MIDLDAHHIADADFWRAEPTVRHAVFAALRDEAPVRWYEPRRSDFARACTGFWAVTRYDDVWTASRNPQLFCSGLGIDIEETPPELGDFLPTMINMDDPEHLRLRRLVSAGFTPKEIARLDAALRTKATEIVDDLLERFGGGEEFDFVEHVASRLPLHAIAGLMGVPAEEQDQVLAWTNTGVALDDPSVGVHAAAAASRAMEEYAQALGRDRLAHPTEDLTSVLMHATVDGERLSPREFANFFGLLVGAGNETTRNAISHGLRLLTEHPDQRHIWFTDFATHAATAAEEIVRYETPITHMCRILTADTVIGGVPLVAGEKVALWYTSANRDGATFERADQFDVRRPGHPQQVGYGAGGPHFCLGANLARREIVVMLDELRRRVPAIRTTGKPERVLSMSLNAIRRLPARLA